MGKRGPPPQPPELKLLKGTFRGHEDQHPNDSPFDKASGMEPPSWLDEFAREVWADTVPTLEAIGMLSRVDSFQLAAYCSSVSLWRNAERLIDEQGITIEVYDREGNLSAMKANPACVVRNQALEKVHKFAIEFGLSPSARARLQISAGQPRASRAKAEGDPLDGKASQASRLFK